MEIGQTVTKISPFFILDFKKFGILTADRGADGQDLVGIGAVVSIICMNLDFASLSSKCPFRPQTWRFGGFDSLNKDACQRNSQKAHPWAERRHYGLSVFAARRYASAVLGVVILSVCHTRAL